MEANMVDHVNYHRSLPDHAARRALWVAGIALALVVGALMLTAFPRLAAVEHPMVLQQVAPAVPVVPIL
jgi:hypothetical protein